MRRSIKLDQVTTHCQIMMVLEHLTRHRTSVTCQRTLSLHFLFPAVCASVHINRDTMIDLRQLNTSLWIIIAMLSSLFSLAFLAASTSASILYAGVNEASGEFGVHSPGNVGHGLPGRFGTDYAFINTVSATLPDTASCVKSNIYLQTAVDIMVNDNKLNVFRVAFLLVSAID